MQLVVTLDRIVCYGPWVLTDIPFVSHELCFVYLVLVGKRTPEPGLCCFDCLRNSSILHSLDDSQLYL